jgi:hypothetical protein
MTSNVTTQGENKGERRGDSSQRGSNVPTQPTVPPMPKSATTSQKK